MKNITLLSFVAATVLFTACGEETKKVAAEADTTETTEVVVKKMDPFGNPIPETK